MYFTPFPKTTYTINGKTETVVDIFRKVGISENTKSTVYIKELVQDTDTVESLAQKYYGDSELSWIILVTNNIIDPVSEFVLSGKNLQSLLDTKYYGNIYYIEEDISLQQGDILIKTTAATNIDPDNLTDADLSTTDYAFVVSYSNEFRYARVTDENGTLVAGTSLVAYRKINDKLTLIRFNKQFSSGADIVESCVIPIKKKSAYIAAPAYLYDTTTNGIVSAYRSYSDSSNFIKLNANGIYDQDNNSNSFRRSILYRFIMNNISVSGVALRTIEQELRLNNEKFREIKILSPELVDSFIEAFEDLISKEQPRFRIITSST